MSLRDDTIIRDERGRIVKGSPGLHRKQEQDTQDQPDPDPDIPDGTIDDDIIAAANSFGSTKTKAGRRAFFESLRDTKPVEFAALLSKALARKANVAQAAAIGTAGVTVMFNTAPTGWCVDAEGKLIEPADAKADWERKHGMQITDEPPAKPVLVEPPDDDDVQLSYDHDDATQPSPRQPDRSTDMNDLLQSIPKPRFTKPRW